MFPKLTATNLNGKKLTMPNEFAGEFNLIIIAFQQWQQSSVNTWIPLCEQLESTLPDFHYYELPTIRSMNFLARSFIDGGMRAGIPSPDTRGRTITLYLDKRDFRQTLEISDESLIHLLLVTPDGEILWRETGNFTDTKAQSLIEFLKKEISINLPG